MKTYLIQQKIQPLVNQYAVYEANQDGQSDKMIGFAQQKRLSFKEKITIYTDDSKQTVGFEIKARQVIDLGARYDITDATGNVLGVIGKDFASSLLRSTWLIFQPGQEEKPALRVQERSQGIAILRRLWDFVPILSEFPFFIKYHFDFTNLTDGQVVASYEKTTTIRDHYRLTIQEGADQFDPRVLVSLGIMLDALQSR